METNTLNLKQYIKPILVIFALGITLTSLTYAFSSSTQDKINDQIITKSNEVAQNSAKWEEANKEIERLTALIDVQAKIQNKAVADNLIARNKLQELQDQLANSYKKPARKVVTSNPVPKSQPTE